MRMCSGLQFLNKLHMSWVKHYFRLCFLIVESVYHRRLLLIRICNATDLREHRHIPHALEQFRVVFFEAVYRSAVSSYYEVVQDMNIQQFAGIDNSFCDLKIIITWRYIPARDGYEPAEWQMRFG